MYNVKKILYVVNAQKDLNYQLSLEVIKCIRTFTNDVFVEDEKLAKMVNLPLIDKESLPGISLTVILGGDGTILNYARHYGEYEIPVLGINIGRVGALAVASLKNYSEALKMFFEGQYFIVKNLTLRGEIHYANKPEVTSFVAYNEVLLHRGLSPRMIPIQISVNNREFEKVFADGIIVATPTGSSAYNLSAGGPLLSTSSNCYVITPVCPQSKGFSSLVISNTDTVHLQIGDLLNAFTDEIIVSVDGCNRYPVNKNDRIDIMKSPTSLNLVQFSEQTSLYDAVYKAIISIQNKGEC